MNKREILSLTAEQLEFIPKVVLLRDFERFVDLLWYRLPERLRTDPEVQRCRACLEHHNRSWQQTHIDGPPPMIKECTECSTRCALHVSTNDSRTRNGSAR